MRLRQRVVTIEQARAGSLGRLVMTYQHQGEQAALDALPETQRNAKPTANPQPLTSHFVKNSLT